MMKNVLKIPLNGQAGTNEEIAEHLEEQIGWIRSGQMGEVRNVYVVVETTDGEIHRNTCGQPCDLARAAGILFAAATRLVTNG